MKKSNFRDIPTSVYRLQLSHRFPFQAAIKRIPYLYNLGIEAIYCSPFFTAYSEHGYDILNPNEINPQLGTRSDYDAFCATLEKYGMQQIVDVVPNHMGICGGKNAWWQDVLRLGPHSSFAHFFDIDWNPPKRELQGKVLMPILGASYGHCLEHSEITLRYEEGRFSLLYADFPLPLAPHSLAYLFEVGGERYAELATFYQTFSYEKAAALEEEGQALWQRLNLPVEELLSLFQGKRQLPSTFDPLDRLLGLQFYRLANWKVASHEINYRRFFNVHELVALHIEEPSVMEAHHKLLFQLVDEKRVHGLRIDHPDGLYDPVAYFKALRERTGLFTVVEKILDREESLPQEWEVEGTVGYEYLNLFNGLFVMPTYEQEFSEIYEEMTGESRDFLELVYRSKKRFANDEMASEVEALGLKLSTLSELDRMFRDFTRIDLTIVLAEVIAAFPIYRTYIASEGGVTRRDAKYLTQAVNLAKERCSHLDRSLFDFVEKVLHLRLKHHTEQFRTFVLQFQQLTGPMMAKGMEDTAFYLYNRFLSLNEVGGDPTHFGVSPSTFHSKLQKKQERWPYGFIASSTHDTKRSEDVRCRLNVLSEIPEKWRKAVRKWSQVAVRESGEPTPNDEYMIYQTLLGVYTPQEHLFDRVWPVILKSLREGKENTSWIRPDLEYEKGVRLFVAALLEPGSRFLKYFLPFHKQIEKLGVYNYLSLTVLKLGAPGVLDIYQGNEHLNHRLVDPDNREPETGIVEDPKYEFYKIGLNFRKKNRQLVLEGSYLPLRVRGDGRNAAIAYAREWKTSRLIVVAARFFAEKIDWEETTLHIPEGWKPMRDLFTGEERRPVKGIYLLSDLFETYPVSVLYDGCDDT